MKTSDEQVIDIKNEMSLIGRVNPVFNYASYDQRVGLCIRVSCQVAIRPPGYIPGTRKIEH
jgi:hypothetical protein